MITIKYCFSFVYFYLLNLIFSQNIWILFYIIYRMSQNSRIPNSESSREGPSRTRKILRKKIRSS
jgi:hypothetical protein